MLSPIEPGDLGSLKAVVEEAVRSAVAKSETEALFLIGDILGSLEAWMQSGSVGFHCLYAILQKPVGFIVVKDHWNLSHLFVAPQHQGTGIGRKLVDAAVASCRTSSPRKRIQLNSSAVAADFYRRCGFVASGDPVKRPGGCIPMELLF